MNTKAIKVQKSQRMRLGNTCTSLEYTFVPCFLFKDVVLTTRTVENKRVWLSSLCLVPHSPFFAYFLSPCPPSKWERKCFWSLARPSTSPHSYWTICVIPRLLFYICFRHFSFFGRGGRGCRNWRSWQDARRWRKYSGKINVITS